MTELNRSKLVSKALLGLALCMLAGVLNAQAPIEARTFADDEHKARYQQLIAELRCPKCLNANLAGSDAPIAADLRNEIYAQVQAGNSDDQIIDYLVERYGEFVLYKPRLHVGTAFLWFGPPLLLLTGFYIARRMLTKPQQLAGGDAEQLSEQERQQLAALLKQSTSTKQAGH